MSCFPSQCKEQVRQRALELGACACGFAAVEPVDAPHCMIYNAWIDSGRSGSMDYCRRYGDVRRNPALLMEGARSIICCAFNYFNPLPDSEAMPMAARISRYAWGDDYHRVVKNRLEQLGAFISDAYGGSTRALVDTAPLRERYWAVRSGIGFVGINNQLTVPGVGAYVFLGELLWSGSFEPDEPCTLHCGGCMACVRACPGAALDGQGGCDARRCLSYLTIEHRGDLPEGTSLHGHAYGCDACLDACPHNKGAKPTAISEFMPRQPLLTMPAGQIQQMSASQYKRATAHSAMRRVPFAQLKRNLDN